MSPLLSQLTQILDIDPDVDEDAEEGAHAEESEHHGR